MSALVKSTIKGSITKTKEQSSKKKKKNSNKQIRLTNHSITSSSPSSSTPHQQHHSAPPSHNQASKTGLDAIHENGEDLSTTDQQQQQEKQNSINPRFPRSSTVPYPAYATVRQTGVNHLPPGQYYYTDDGTLVHGSISPAQLNAYYHSGQPLSIINTNFQPISPHHQYTRPVDILKPTFLIVPKAAKQRLTAQLSASTSPITVNRTKTSPTKSITKQSDTKSPQKSVTQSPTPSRTVEIQKENQSSTTKIMDIGLRHIGMIATPNPSPYIHFASKKNSTQTSQEGLPETSVLSENLNDQNQTSATIRSMPNISLTQGKTTF